MGLPIFRKKKGVSQLWLTPCRHWLVPKVLPIYPSLCILIKKSVNFKYFSTKQAFLRDLGSDSPFWRSISWSEVQDAGMEKLEKDFMYLARISCFGLWQQSIAPFRVYARWRPGYSKIANNAHKLQKNLDIIKINNIKLSGKIFAEFGTFLLLVFLVVERYADNDKRTDQANGRNNCYY